MSQPRKRTIEAYNKSVLNSPSYTPTRLHNKLIEHLYPDLAENQTVSNRTLSKLLDISHSTLSHVWARDAVLSARMILSIMDITGWTRQQFNIYSGMVPYVKPYTKEQLEELRRGEGTVVEPVRPPRSGKRAAKRKALEHLAARKNAD